MEKPFGEQTDSSLGERRVPSLRGHVYLANDLLDGVFLGGHALPFGPPLLPPLCLVRRAPDPVQRGAFAWCGLDTELRLHVAVCPVEHLDGVGLKDRVAHPDDAVHYLHQAGERLRRRLLVGDRQPL